MYLAFGSGFFPLTDFLNPDTPKKEEEYVLISMTSSIFMYFLKYFFLYKCSVLMSTQSTYYIFHL